VVVGWCGLEISKWGVKVTDPNDSETPLGHYAPARTREASELTPVQQEICRRIMEGESVRTICKDEHMPCRSTVLNWLAAEPAFRAGYSFAKQLLAETMAEDIIAIADDASADWVEGEQGASLNYEHVQRARLRIDSRKWLAGKLAPKRYGDASTLRIGGGLDDTKREMTTEEIAVRFAAIAHAINKRKGD